MIKLILAIEDIIIPLFILDISFTESQNAVDALSCEIKYNNFDFPLFDYYARKEK